MEKGKVPFRPIRINCQTCKGEKFTLEPTCCGELGKRHGQCCDEPVQDKVPCTDCEGKGEYTVKNL